MTLSELWQTSPTILQPPFAESLRVVARDNGKPPLAQLSELLRLVAGPGKLEPGEYYYYRLFDDRYNDRLRRSFVGKRLEPTLHRLTCQPGSWLLAHDKLVCYSLLQTLGYPVPRTQAIYRRGAGFPGLTVLSDRTALTKALRGGLAGPLFGKPVRGIRSVGTLSLDGYDAGSDSVRLTHDHLVNVNELADALETYAEGGYLFQSRIRQHAAVAEVCGDAVGTARVLVLVGADRPVVHRAVWKLPVGSNIADNFWREGNIIAALDPDSGRVIRAIQGNGINLREIEVHPTSGKPLVGFALPDWSSVRDLVLSAQSAFPGLRMQAWDVAFGADGPLLVELNVGGDYNLPQLATGRGMLEARFLDFLGECAVNPRRKRLVRRLRRVLPA